MNSKKYLITVFALTLCTGLFSQFTDNFTDGDFTNNPTWSGNDVKFSVTSGELQLTAPAVTETAYLSTPSQAINSAQWDFFIRLEFNPSGSNFSRVYLVSSSADLTQNLNGYYVQVGSTDDDICLYKQSGATRTKIIDGINGLLSTNIADATIRVTRTTNGDWELLADTLAGTNYASQGVVNDVTHLQSLFAGVFCNYTSTRSQDFFYDNFVVTGTPFTDNVPPAISSITVVGNNGLNILFTEPVTPVTAQVLTNYNLSNGLGNPATAVINGGNNAQVDLTFSGTFTPQTIYTLFIENVEDFSGNMMADSTLIVSLFQPAMFDVVINEIMAAPDNPASPSDLPNEEYVELFNRTSFPIDLANWQLVVNSSIKTIQSYVLQPDSFVIITDNTLSGAFPAGTPIAQISTTSMGLVNGGASLTLKEPLGTIIDHVSYNTSFYNNTILDDGGYSMERVNPNEVCAGSKNWRATLDLSGGTPGRRNFWYNTNPIAFEVGLEEVISAQIVDIHFTKLPDSLSVVAGDFVIDQGIGAPDSFDLLTPEIYRLYFSNSLNPNQLYYLTIADSIEECNGNALPIGTQIQVVYYVPQVFDIVFNELMVDPTPPVMLTADEYVELYNRTSLPLNLKNWVIKTGSNEFTLPSCELPADSFLLVGNLGVVFSNPGTNAVGLLTDLSLPNEGNPLSLISPSGTVIHFIQYSDGWYKNTAKKDGGWSLEQIDPQLPCLGEENWAASEDTTGGSPGRANSIQAALIDTTNPVMLRAGFSATDTLLIYFTESLQPNTFQTSDFIIDNGIGNPLSVEVMKPDYKVTRLILPVAIVQGTEYRVSMTGNASDCAGNIADTISVRFGIPLPADSGDILINEVLYDPIGDGEDYVEIYNISDHPVDLKDIRLASADTVTGQLESVKIISTTSALIMPGEYTLLSRSSKIVLSQYQTENERAFWNISEIPSYSNTYGVVAICDPSFQLIDKFFYTEDYQFPLLNTSDGVSLERISWDKPTQEKSNWHSAAQTIGFGTPGYLNSQFIPVPTTADNFAFNPDIFSPDLDGYQDVLNIEYQFDQPGYIANIQIYDAGGRLIKDLVDNQLLGTQGSFYWDGISDAGDKGRIGIYVAWFEVFDLDGNKQSFQKVFTLAGKI